MLLALLTSNRDVIIARATARVAARMCLKPSDVELAHGIPVFLDQLGAALRLAKSGEAIDRDGIDGEKIGRSAGLHGQDLHRVGRNIDQVVLYYGDVCQTVTELASEQTAPIPAREFQTLNLCLDVAIAGAVAEFARQREHTAAARGIERLGVLAHELRNKLNTAMLARESIKSRRAAASEKTGLVLDRSLLGLRDLIDRALAEVRLDAGIERRERISVAELIEQIELGAFLQAQARGLLFSVTSVDRGVTIEGDRQILAAAIANLLQNAFKFTRKGSHVSLTVRATPDRVFVEVEDECGGLPPGKTDDLFRAFMQQGDDRSGVGLGLSICSRAAKASDGEILVRDLPGKGCVFTLALPRKTPPSSSSVG